MNTFTRTLSAPVPPTAPGASIVATALLEAPDVNGQPGEWTAIEAKPGALPEVASRFATLSDGWYCLQWHDDKQVSRFSDPVRLSGRVASNAGKARR